PPASGRTCRHGAAECAASAAPRRAPPQGQLGQLLSLRSPALAGPPAASAAHHRALGRSATRRRSPDRLLLCWLLGRSGDRAPPPLVGVPDDAVAQPSPVPVPGALGGCDVVARSTRRRVHLLRRRAPPPGAR